MRPGEQASGAGQRVGATGLPAQGRGQAQETPRFFSVPEVARIFGMSPVTVYRAIAAGEFPAVRIRGRLIVPAKAVEEMAEVAMAEHAVVDAGGWVPFVPSPQRAREA
ncbi:MAG: helix-turn-helix domain-containing protein [Pseudonocardia sp.]